jgi:hypothetical protein
MEVPFSGRSATDRLRIEFLHREHGSNVSTRKGASTPALMLRIVFW